MIFENKRVQYIAQYEIFVDGKITDRGNTAFDTPEGVRAGDLHEHVVAVALEGAGNPVGGKCLIVGLFKL